MPNAVVLLAAFILARNQAFAQNGRQACRTENTATGIGSDAPMVGPESFSRS